jgi:NTE family protein
MMARSLALWLASLILTACSMHPENRELVRHGDTRTYGSRHKIGDDFYVMLAFSGGGTRAAAFSFGLLESLREANYESKNGNRKLLDDVRVISSVSGGSITAGDIRRQVYYHSTSDHPTSSRGCAHLLQC